MMMSKNPATSTMTPTCSAALPPLAPSSTCSPMPPAPSSKSAADPQPMDLDHMKSRNPPQTCYNCNKPGHIAWNCLEPCMHRVCNADPLSPETIQAIVEAIRIGVRGDATRGEGVTGDIKPMRSKARSHRILDPQPARGAPWLLSKNVLTVNTPLNHIQCEEHQRVKMHPERSKSQCLCYHPQSPPHPYMSCLSPPAPST